VVLNPGAGREIVAWRSSDVQAWKDSRPQRSAHVITERAYAKRRRPKKLGRPE
jgi:hypothetical protein